jgi:hypothetical protein
MTTITDIGVTGEGAEELKLLHLVDQFYADPLGLFGRASSGANPAPRWSTFPAQTNGSARS